MTNPAEKEQLEAWLCEQAKLLFPNTEFKKRSTDTSRFRLLFLKIREFSTSRKKSTLQNILEAALEKKQSISRVDLSPNPPLNTDLLQFFIPLENLKKTQNFSPNNFAPVLKENERVGGIATLTIQQLRNALFRQSLRPLPPQLLNKFALNQESEFLDKKVYVAGIINNEQQPTGIAFFIEGEKPKIGKKKQNPVTRTVISSQQAQLIPIPIPG